MRLVFILFTIVCISVESADAQHTKTTEHVNRIWLGYLTQTRFSDKWGMWADFHLRTKENFVEGLSQSIIRLGATYYITDNTKLTLGYAYVNDFPADNHKNISVPEHRPWQQVQWHTKYGKNRMMQWIRLEERFRHKVKNDDELAEGYYFNWRLRYNFWYEIPLSKKGIVPNSFSFILNDELHINFGKQIVYNYFDQNRLFLGLKYQTGEYTNLQVGYMNLFQQLAAGNKYRDMNVLRFFFFQNFDLRKKN